jgi:transposase
MKQEKVNLTVEDKKNLQDLLSKGTLKARIYKRALGLLELDKGKTYQEVSNILNMSYPTVHGWGKKYNLEGLVFIKDKPRTGRPLQLTGEQKAKVTALACSTPPNGYAKWSLRLLADSVVELNYVEEISHTEIGRILKKMNCNLIEKDNGALVK